MKTQMWAVALVAFCTILTSLGQYFYKLAANSLVLAFPDILLNTNRWMGMVLYGTSALRGGDLSVLYPVVSLSFIWVTLLAMFFLSEPLTIPKIGGICCILGGIWLIGSGSK